jgi:transcriptional regulator with XRE-family HTH domain
MHILHIGQNIAVIRKRLQLTQKEFAETLGISKTSVSLWENQKKYPSRKNISTMLSTLKLNPRDLFEIHSEDTLFLQHALPFPPSQFKIKEGIQLHVQNEKLSQSDIALLPKAVQILKLLYS